MKTIRLRRHSVTFQPESARVIIRPFIPGKAQILADILARALALSEAEAEAQLQTILAEFASRHFDIESLLLAHYEKVRPQFTLQSPLSRVRQLLIGALFSGEYALESAALFNPSIVLHPDQNGTPAGGMRFIMSLRATGEGHISSIEFRTGVIAPDGTIAVDPASRFVTAPEVVPNPTYRKRSFLTKLNEMGFGGSHAAAVMEPLAENFTLLQLDESMARVRRDTKPVTRDLRRALETFRWLADSNYELNFSSKLAMSERIIFPVSPNESNGIEDARFVRFVEDDGSVRHFATYTAFDGSVTLPQIVETDDFIRFRVSTLNGPEIANKGMAMFPRRINGNYCMLSRQDGENIYFMASENRHFWHTKKLVLRPSHPWQYVQIGNCGSPIETPAGWLVITHGVGPMRKYSIGAALLDLDDPTKVLGRLPTPLLSPMGNERSGYVPNVVYSCGGLVHEGLLVIPYAMSDYATTFATVPLQAVLDAMMEPP